MFDFLKKTQSTNPRIEEYITGAKDRVESIMHSATASNDSGVKYSARGPAYPEDCYDVANISYMLEQARNHPMDSKTTEQTISKLLATLNRSFSDTVIDYMRAKNLANTDVYKAAGVDRKLFSKIVSNRDYRPSKDTAISIALALKLNAQEAGYLINRAGFTFSHSIARDVVLEYCFMKEIYNLIDVNTILSRLGERALQ